jgi:hypothetical protein
MITVTVHHHTPHLDFTGVDVQPVARVTAHVDDVMDALEYAYAATQNFEGSWSRGPTMDNGHGFQVGNPDWRPGVEVLAPLPQHEGKTYGLRSSMSGDTFEVDGQPFRCASFGFEPLPTAQG